jgi:hypothetical protein
MIERTSAEDLLTLFNTADPSVEEIAKYIDQEIQRLPMKLLVVDNLITDCYDEFVDGNIRIVFEK